MPWRLLKKHEGLSARAQIAAGRPSPARIRVVSALRCQWNLHLCLSNKWNKVEFALFFIFPCKPLILWQIRNICIAWKGIASEKTSGHSRRPLGPGGLGLSSSAGQSRLDGQGWLILHVFGIFGHGSVYKSRGQVPKGWAFCQGLSGPTLRLEACIPFPSSMPPVSPFLSTPESKFLAPFSPNSFSAFWK